MYIYIYPLTHSFTCIYCVNTSCVYIYIYVYMYNMFTSLCYPQDGCSDGFVAISIKSMQRQHVWTICSAHVPCIYNCTTCMCICTYVYITIYIHHYISIIIYLYYTRFLFHKWETKPEGVTMGGGRSIPPSLHNPFLVFFFAHLVQVVLHCAW